MAFKLDRKRSNRKVAVTPWEKYQNQQEEREKAAKKQRRPSRIGAKLPWLKHQKHRRLLKRMSILVGIFAVILLVAGYFATPISHISKISVTGNRVVKTASVEKMTGLKTGDSIYKVSSKNAKQISKRVKQTYPRVKSISFKIKKHNQLAIHVVEYQTAGFVPSNGYYRIALESGVISKERQKQPTGNYPVYDKFTSARRLHQMILQFAKLQPKIKTGISEIQFSPTKSNPERIHVFMNDGNEVYATLSTFAAKMAYYPSIAAKMKRNGVVNLEIGAYSYPFSS
ncbi:hypothetical protein AYR62_04395 [Secundilactobacillus paracollinoides]|uniref:Cell division protein DivIB n=1 Tax=Secundilactobacillus paracollinoides TaxID=240427 RepID=A0A1B2J092_9LACO|nr:FtsQ-type POTRA domain-containing protein [Secundilactobacillus paracollinoides]ANZ61760.1 hypothetical protein AYR61_10680 [Secundilactobacillus paracollinoides]ANZ63395.1 hypothetical protein AYR62_04395 [Secundilactobacillus paracollinoides]ANZ67679.1 hypothetical protein AYR63_11435 [Secundilactobacillus paracollinoides]KRL79603.1 cell division septal protein [Secundilactobacillus paracollinoides DSM 15502 = JCM 11969]